MPRTSARGRTWAEQGPGEPRSLGSRTAASHNSRVSVHPLLPLLYQAEEGRRGLKKGSDHGLSPHAAKWIHGGPRRHRNSEGQGFSAALVLEGAGKGQEAGEEWLGLVLGLYDAVLFDGPVHSVYDHSLHLPLPHSQWSSRRRPEVSHKYSSILMNGVPCVHCPQCH